MVGTLVAVVCSAATPTGIPEPTGSCPDAPVLAAGDFFESPRRVHGAAAAAMLAQTVVATVTVLPTTFACVALSDWMTTQPERTIAPPATATAVRPARRSGANRRRGALGASELTRFSFVDGPTGP